MLLREVGKSTMVEETMAVNVQDGSTRVIDPDQKSYFILIYGPLK